MALHSRDEERSFSLHGNHIAGLATPSRGPGEVEVWRSKMDAGAATPPHCHDTEEVIVFLSGRGRARIENDEVTFGPGDTLILPANKQHQIFSETASESIVAMPRRSKICDGEGAPLPLPWRD